MKRYELLLLENKAWALDKLEEDPDFFKDTSKGQTPQFLWIGCSDSRVPAEDITNSSPGSMFVHRNIANQALMHDENFLSVLEFSVNVLNINHIIVCGHYECGGIKAALADYSVGHVGQWLNGIKVMLNQEKETLIQYNEGEKTNKAVELNVIKQINNISETSIIKNARENGRTIVLHGLVYDLKTGLLKDIIMK